MSDIQTPSPKLPPLPGRVQAILDELSRATHEYVEVKHTFDQARGQFEIAREKFGTVKRLAAEMLPWLEWSFWQEEHPDVKFAGIPIGEAILAALRDHALKVAYEHVNHPSENFVPEMTPDLLVEALESGGFEFRSATPLREINAAVINRKGIIKRASGYRIEDADQILELIKESVRNKQNSKKQGKRK